MNHKLFPDVYAAGNSATGLECSFVNSHWLSILRHDLQCKTTMWKPVMRYSWASKGIGGAMNATASNLIQHVGVNHRRTNILMSQQLLNGSDVIARGEKVGGEGMSHCMTRGVFADPGITNRLLD